MLWRLVTIRLKAWAKGQCDPSVFGTLQPPEKLGNLQMTPSGEPAEPEIPPTAVKGKSLINRGLPLNTLADLRARAQG